VRVAEKFQTRPLPVRDDQPHVPHHNPGPL
jgi:hypothetical protein